MNELRCTTRASINAGASLNLQIPQEWKSVNMNNDCSTSIRAELLVYLTIYH